LHASHTGHYCPARRRVSLLLQPPAQARAGAWADGAAWLDDGRAGVVHEATHLLAWSCGVLAPGVSYPWWVVEGMAVRFEVVAAGSTAGVTVPVHFAELHRAGGLLPLSEFTGLAGPPSRLRHNQDAWALMYCQAWALFRIALEAYPAQLQAFLADVADAQPAAEAAAQRCGGCLGPSRPAAGPSAALWAALFAKHFPLPPGDGWAQLLPP